MDFQEQIEKVNKQHAIQGEVKTALADILQSLNKERLQPIASAYDVPGRSKMNKGELRTSSTL